MAQIISRFYPLYPFATQPKNIIVPSLMRRHAALYCSLLSIEKRPLFNFKSLQLNQCPKKLINSDLLLLNKVSLKCNSTKSDLSKTSKLRKAVAEYGATVMVFHIALSLASLGMFYMIVSSGIDIVKLLETLGLSNNEKLNGIAANAGTFVVAYAVHKIFAPVRITITLAATPFIVRYLRTIGFLKSSKSQPCLKK